MFRLLLPVSLTFLLIACGGGNGGSSDSDTGIVDVSQTQSQVEAPVANGLTVSGSPSETPAPEVATGLAQVADPDDEPIDAEVATGLTVSPSPGQESSTQNPADESVDGEVATGFSVFAIEAAPVAAGIIEAASVTEEQLLTNSTGLIDAARVDTTQGVFFTSLPPLPTGGIPSSSPTADTQTIISGGSLSLDIGTDAGFFRIYVSSDNDDGYFLIELPEETNRASVFLALSSIQLDGGVGEISVQVERADGAISDPLIFPVTTLSVGAGELQVSVIWDQPVDMDLALFEPDGTGIFFANAVSPSGGMLDLDSNPVCLIDGINNENITYDGSIPPSGEYTVFISLYSACEVVEPINFIVTVRVNGGVQTFNGTLTAADESLFFEITRFNLP